MAAALASGIPVGNVCGRVAWLLTAALAAGALVLAAVVAALPGEAAARANPSTALRSE